MVCIMMKLYPMKLRKFKKKLRNFECTPILRQARSKSTYHSGDHVTWKRYLPNGEVRYTGFSEYKEIIVSVIKDVLKDLEISREEWSE